MAHRRALPGTVVPWSPDFPRASCETRGRPALWRRQYGLLRSWQQQSEQFRPALAVDNPVDEIGAETPLERDHRFLRIGHVITETLEREEEAGVGPVRIDQLARGAREGETALRQRRPREELARILLS